MAKVQLHQKTNEQLQKTRPKKRTKKIATYSAIFNILKTYHNFSFKLPNWNKNLSKSQRKKDIQKARNSAHIRDLMLSGNFSNKQIIQKIKDRATEINTDRNLSPQQKGSIYRLWHGTAAKRGLSSSISKVESGLARFVPIVNIRGKPQYYRMKRTNKGIFLMQRDIRVELLGRGTKERIKIRLLPSTEEGVTIQVPMRRQVFHPFPKVFDIEKYVKKLEKEHKPQSMAIVLGSTIANTKKFNVHELLHGDSNIVQLIKNMENNNIKIPFSGVMFYYY